MVCSELRDHDYCSTGGQNEEDSSRLSTCNGMGASFGTSAGIRIIGRMMAATMAIPPALLFFQALQGREKQGNEAGRVVPCRGQIERGCKTGAPVVDGRCTEMEREVNFAEDPRPDH